MLRTKGIKVIKSMKKGRRTPVQPGQSHNNKTRRKGKRYFTLKNERKRIKLHFKIR